MALLPINNFPFQFNVLLHGHMSGTEQRENLSRLVLG